MKSLKYIIGVTEVIVGKVSDDEKLVDEGFNNSKESFWGR